MKSISNNKILFFLLLLCCSCGADRIERIEDSSGDYFPQVHDRYIYPIVPGTDVWRQLSSTDEAFAVCQLPENILNTISTFGLIDATLFFPLFISDYLLSSSSPKTTWYRLFSRLNSVGELIRREDAANSVVDYYKAVNTDKLFRAKEKTSFGNTLRLSGLEYLCTKSEIISNMSPQKKVELLDALLSNYRKKPQRESPVIAMAQILLLDQYAPLISYYQKESIAYLHSIEEGYLCSQEEIIISMVNNYKKDVLK